MKSRFILFKRAGVYYTGDTTTRKQISLRRDWSDTSNPNGVWKYTDGAGDLLGTNYGVPLNPSGEVAQALWGQTLGNQNWFKSAVTEAGWQQGDVITSLGGFA